MTSLCQILRFFGIFLYYVFVQALGVITKRDLKDECVKIPALESSVVCRNSYGGYDFCKSSLDSGGGVAGCRDRDGDPPFQVEYRSFCGGVRCGLDEGWDQPLRLYIVTPVGYELR